MAGCSDRQPGSGTALTLKFDTASVDTRSAVATAISTMASACVPAPVKLWLK